MSRHIVGGYEMKAPVITVFKNGNCHFPGKKVVITKHIRNFENFLDKVTRETNAKNAVRKVYTPRGGTLISNLEKVENGGVYICAGVEKFRRIDYGTTVIKPIRKSTIRVNPQIRKAISSRFRKEEPLKSRVVFISKNGEQGDKPYKFLIDKRMLTNMEGILQHLSYKLKLRAGPVKSLCTLDGKKIKHIDDLVTNQHYVAVPYQQTFIKGKYKNLVTTVPQQKIPLRKKYMGTFVGLRKSRVLRNVYNKGIPRIQDIEHDSEFQDYVEENNQGESTSMEGELLDNDHIIDVVEGEDSTIPQENENTEEEENKEEEENLNGVEDSNEDKDMKDDEFEEAFDDYTEKGDENEESYDDFETNEVMETKKEPDIRNSERTSWSPGHKPSGKGTSKQRYRATGQQSENAEEVKDDKKVAVEKTIDMLPAATVKEELENQHDSEEGDTKEEWRVG